MGNASARWSGTRPPCARCCSLAITQQTVYIPSDGCWEPAATLHVALCAAHKQGGAGQHHLWGMTGKQGGVGQQQPASSPHMSHVTCHMWATQGSTEAWQASSQHTGQHPMNANSLATQSPRAPSCCTCCSRTNTQQPSVSNKLLMAERTHLLHRMALWVRAMRL